jgi:hypothetical protein
LPEATPGTGVVRTPWHAQSAEGRPLSGHGTGGCTPDPRGGPSGVALHGHAVPLQGRPSATIQGIVAAPRPHQSSRRHDDGAHAAAQASRGEGAPAVAERPRALRDPHQAAGKDARGEKHTGGRRWSEGASQRPWRLPQRRFLGRVRDIIRLVPCGLGACGVTVPGSRCKSFV